jgi:hypothetical protein
MGTEPMSMIPTPIDPIIETFTSRRFGGPAFAGHGAGFAGDRLRPRMGQTFDKMMEMPLWVGDALRLVGHGGMATVALYLGVTQSGAWSTIGWVVGIMSGFAALLDICSLIGEIFGPRPGAPPAAPEA